MTDLSRRSILAGVSAATATLSTAAALAHPVGGVLAAPAPIFAAIEAHRAAWEAFGATCESLEEAENAYEPPAREPMVHSVKGRAYSVELGRYAILERISDDFERVRISLRHDLEMIGYSKRKVFAALAALDAKETACLDAATALFDAEDEHKAASPLGAAERDYKRVSDAEVEAFMAVIVCSCRTPAETAAKAAYLLTTSTVKDCLPQAKHMRALLLSLTGGEHG